MFLKSFSQSSMFATCHPDGQACASSFSVNIFPLSKSFFIHTWFPILTVLLFWGIAGLKNKAGRSKMKRHKASKRVVCMFKI